VNPFEVLFHLDRHLNDWAGTMGAGFYALLFLVIFAETGLVVVPFLPGDSLLLAIGALSLSPQCPFDVIVAATAMSAGAVVGDSTNYWIGRYVGPRVFTSERSKWLNQDHLRKAEAFYEKHGGKTVILCRFIAVIRTFAPFVAGVGRMHYPRFLTFSVVGTLLWVPVFVLAGRFVADTIGAENIHWVVLGIIVFAFVPTTVSWLRRRASGRRTSAEAGENPSR
jgi:membrane-associated protein